MEKPSSWRRISACLRLTVMSSRNTSLWGLRPALVTSFSIRNVDPAFGPCLTRKESLPRLELVLRERELIPRLTFDLDRGEADGGLLLEGSPQFAQ